MFKGLTTCVHVTEAICRTTHNNTTYTSLCALHASYGEKTSSEIFLKCMYNGNEMMVTDTQTQA